MELYKVFVTATTCTGTRQCDLKMKKPFAYSFDLHALGFLTKGDNSCLLPFVILFLNRIVSSFYLSPCGSFCLTAIALNSHFMPVEFRTTVGITKWNESNTGEFPHGPRYGYLNIMGWFTRSSVFSSKYHGGEKCANQRPFSLVLLFTDFCLYGPLCSLYIGPMYDLSAAAIIRHHIEPSDSGIEKGFINEWSTTKCLLLVARLLLSRSIFGGFALSL